MSTRQIPQLLHGMPIVDEKGVPLKWFVDAWNDMLDRTGGQAVDLVGNIINGTQQLDDVNIAGASLTGTLNAINSNVDAVAADAAVGAGSLVVTLSAIAASGVRRGSGTVTTNAVTALVSGGTGPYVYTLTKDDGDTIAYTLSGANNETVTFSEALDAGETLQAQYRWTVEDSLSATGSKSFNATLNALEYSYSGSILP